MLGFVASITLFTKIPSIISSYYYHYWGFRVEGSALGSRVQGLGFSDARFRWQDYKIERQSSTATKMI